jgi:SprT protein
MRLLSPSRTGSKQNKTLRIFKQLEFLAVGQALRLPDSNVVAASLRDAKRHSGSEQFRGRDHALEEKSRTLLRKLGAGKLAREIRVEWNPRMRTAAGRAHFREKLISLNPLLRDHDLASVSRQSGSDIDRTLRHELAHLLAQFRVGRHRIAPHGVEWREACRDLGIADEVRCHNLPFASKTYAPRYVYRCLNCKEKFPRVRKIRRAIACLACCQKHNGGGFDPRFRLQLVSEFGGARAVVPLK